MKNLKVLMSSILFLVISLACSAQVYDRKLANHKEKTKKEFFKLMSTIENKLSDSTLTQEQQYSLFDPIVDYADSERSTLTKMRKKYLMKTPLPPHTLSDTLFDTLEDMDLMGMLQERKFTTVTFLQCYRPQEIANLVTGLFQSRIFKHSGLSSNEASMGHIFGSQVFAKYLQKDQWQISLINRLYGFRFNLDLQTMYISNPQYIAPYKLSYLHIHIPFNVLKQSYELDNLYQKLNEVRWNTYSIDLLKESSKSAWQDTVEQRMLQVYVTHQSRFLRVQHKVIQDLAPGSALDSSWEDFTALTTAESQLLGKALNAYLLEPDAAAYELFSITNGMSAFNENIEEIGKNAMLGFLNYRMEKTGDNTWRIQSKGYSIAFEYDWNIKKGSFSGLKVYQRKGTSRI